MEIDAASRQLMLEMHAEGLPVRVLDARPDLPPGWGQAVAMYHEVDRSEMGRPLLTSMRAALDEMGVKRRTDRDAIRAVWWQMHAADVDRRDKKKSSKKPDSDS